MRPNRSVILGSYGVRVPMNESPRTRRAARAAASERSASPRPATTGGRILAAALAAGLIIASLLPWWNAEPPLSRVIDHLSMWHLLFVGVSLGELGKATQFSLVGNALFGLFSTLPTVLLIIALVVRAIRPASMLGKHIRLLGVSSVIGTVWLFLFAFLRSDAANGQPLILIGPWIALLLAIAASVFGHLWWQQAKTRFPKRVRASRATEPEEGTIEDLVGVDLDGDGEIGTGRPAPRRATVASAPALDLDSDDMDDDDDDLGTIAIDTLRDDDEDNSSRTSHRR